MKKLILALLLPIFLLSLQIPPASAFEDVCEDLTESVQDINDPWGLCWGKADELDVKEYKIYRSRNSGDDVPEFYMTVLANDPFDEEAQKGCLETNCFSGPFNLADFSIGLWFLRYTVADATSEGPLSNEVKVEVVDKPPSQGSGCSIRLF